MGIYLPERVVSSAELVAGCAKSSAFPLEKYTGIRSRRFASDEEFSFDLALRAVERCQAMSPDELDGVDLIICGNCSRMDGPRLAFAYEPSMAARLAHHFGLGPALAFDVSNACAGLWTALHIADSMLRAGLARRALIVSGEYITHLARTAQLEIESAMDPRVPCLTLGDSGAALLLEASEQRDAGLAFVDLRTLGRYGQYCVARPTEQTHGGAIMHTNMIKLGAVGVKEAVRHALKVMQQRGVNLNDVEHVIPHQTSATNFNEAARIFSERFGQDAGVERRLFNNLADRGNTATTSTFLAAWDGMRSGRIQNHDSALFGITGSGITVGSALYRFDDLPTRVRLSAEASVPRSEALKAVAGVRVLHFEQRPVVTSLGSCIPHRDARLDTKEMLRAAASDCLARSGLTRNQIELLIHVGIYRSGFVVEPSVAAMMAGELQINDVSNDAADEATFAFDLSSGGSGFLSACAVVAALLQADGLECAMVLASEYDNNLDLALEQRRGIVEAATAVMLERSTKRGIESIAFAQMPQTLHCLTVNAAQESGRPFLQIAQSPELEDTYVATATLAALALLEQNGLGPDAPMRIIAPNCTANLRAKLARAIGLVPERFVESVVAGDGLTSNTQLMLQSLQAAHEPCLTLIIEVAAGVQAACALYR